MGRSPSEAQQREGGREEARGPSEDLQKSWLKWREGITFPWQPESVIVARRRQKPSAKFDIPIFQYRDINIILGAQIAATVIG